ncbi:DUF262 domain-containing protein [Marinobacter confluentis]|uniref:DUF262 domain-containing protein n=1 Tax=Marinobacter confluentis TaxID=1697557 RepID=A0A4Z1BWF8_9GAMM|nr:DUF262 domain-containing protein [Marinobacter confluentis]TGN41659.1 DUF262 domain-containing protein [Marinobacter confluentis]
MRLLPSDPDIQTLYGRIKNSKIDLQPDFQRGEVWTEDKKKALIDTILRGWHVPPIHIIVVEETGEQEVLDGQQRLVAIRDFMSGAFPVDGYCEPFNKDMKALDGLFYEELPPKHKNLFDSYSIRQFLITDFEPGEPGELFHRLNQHVRLTPAEKRNAFYGPVRVQIKDLVKGMQELGIDKSILGFSNSRMAYDDVLSKFLLYVERGSIREKITEGDVTNLFRRNFGFSDSTVNDANAALKGFAEAFHTVSTSKVKFNKATLLSWLLFFLRIRVSSYSPEITPYFLLSFEMTRLSARRGSDEFSWDQNGTLEGGLEEILHDQLALINLFNDRASSRVADVSSVIARDFVLHYCFFWASSNISFSYDSRLSDRERQLLRRVLEREGMGQPSNIVELEKISEDWGMFV